jgi:hypothetical protein
VKRSDTLREILQGCGRVPGNRTEVGGVLASREKRAFRSGYSDFDDHAVPEIHKVPVTDSMALASRRWLESYTVTASLGQGIESSGVFFVFALNTNRQFSLGDLIQAAVSFAAERFEGGDLA